MSSLYCTTSVCLDKVCNNSVEPDRLMFVRQILQNFFPKIRIICEKNYFTSISKASEFLRFSTREHTTLLKKIEYSTYAVWWRFSSTEMPVSHQNILFIQHRSYTLLRVYKIFLWFLNVFTVKHIKITRPDMGSNRESLDF